MYFVYVLRSEAFERFYVGMTEDVERRIGEHNKGRTQSTKFYAPWNLVFVEKFETRIESQEKREVSKGRFWKRVNKEILLRK